jgi:hypothetical protein
LLALRSQPMSNTDKALRDDIMPLAG